MFRTAEAFPWELPLLLTMLNRQPWCRCGRGYLPDVGVIASMNTEPEHVCECGEHFPIRDGYLRAFTKDYTRQAQVAFLSNWVQGGYVDSTERSERIDVRFIDPMPEEIIDVLPHPQIQFPKDIAANPAVLHDHYAQIAVAAVNVTTTGFQLLVSHALPANWSLRTTWRSYGRRRALDLPPWRDLLRQALLVERGQILDPAIGMLHSAFEAFVNAAVVERLVQREAIDATAAARILDAAEDGLAADAKRQSGVVLALVDVLRERCGFPALGGTPVADEWAMRVRRPRNDIFHGEPIRATPEDARLAFASTLTLMNALDRSLIPALVLECYAGLSV